MNVTGGMKGEVKMKGQPETVMPREGHFVRAKIGNAADCRRAISAAIAKRAYEIYERQGRRRGRDQENWWALRRAKSSSPSAAESLSRGRTDRWRSGKGGDEVCGSD
jgi:hypothetical protein